MSEDDDLLSALLSDTPPPAPTVQERPEKQKPAPAAAPNGMRRGDRRYRVRQSGLVICSNGSKAPVMIADLSASGIGLLTDATADQGTVLRIVATIRYGGHAICLDFRAQVRYVMYVGSLRKNRIGLQFEPLHPDMRANINKLLDHLPPC